MSFRCDMLTTLDYIFQRPSALNESHTVGFTSTSIGVCFKRAASLGLREGSVNPRFTQNVEDGISIIIARMIPSLSKFWGWTKGAHINVL